jgi:indolepyruvate ferredoxin oxidoreductase beta subunit
MQVVITGRGGQGVILLARVFGEWAVAKGEGVISTETHGMATRGGSVLTQLKIGNYFSPGVAKGKGDLGIAMHPQERENAARFLKRDAPLVVNQEETREGCEICLNASRLSQEHLGTPLYANLVMAGFVGKSLLNAELEELNRALLGVISKRVEENLKALRLGYEYEERRDVSARI